MTMTFGTVKVKFDQTYQGFRSMYFSEHRSATPCAQKPLGRTIFLTCVPPWMTKSSLENIFAVNGPIQSVFIERKPNPGPVEESEADPDDEKTAYPLSARYLYPLSRCRLGFGFKYAYIVFKTASAMKACLNHMDSSKVHLAQPDPKTPIVCGILKWKQEYNSGLMTAKQWPDLKQEIDTFTATFDQEKEEAVKKAQDLAEPDDEGWVTVSRHTSRKPVLKLSAKVQARIKAKDALRRKRKELENFYKFQAKESKLNRIQELKKKFEQDKLKQIQLKQKDRKFKPV